jgi:hypothetical protein
VPLHLCTDRPWRLVQDCRAGMGAALNTFFRPECLSCRTIKLAQRQQGRTGAVVSVISVVQPITYLPVEAGR